MTRPKPACAITDATCNGVKCPARAVVNIEWLAEVFNGKSIAEMIALKRRIVERGCPQVVVDYLDLLLEVKVHKKTKRRHAAGR